jgi:hypothetical protein
MLTLVISTLAGVAVPPSSPLPGISDFERTLAMTTAPILLAAFVLALCALLTSLAGRARVGGLLGVLSLILINISGLLTGQYGVDGVGLLGTLLVTSPVAAIFAGRETAWRRAEGKAARRDGAEPA